MKILKYQFTSDNWNFSPINFQNINLLVGDSGSGKTRLLNTIFNIGAIVAQNKMRGEGEWHISLGVDDNIYEWEIKIVGKEEEQKIVNEILYLNEKKLFERKNEICVFNDQELPKLSNKEILIYLFREDEKIKPIYEGFASILRRSFFHDELEKNSAIYGVNFHHLDKIGKKRDLYELYKLDLGLNPKLFILFNYFPEIYQKINEIYLDTFDFISEIKILQSEDFPDLRIPGQTPIWCIKENNLDEFIRLDQLSSGMQKVLLIITDILTLPNGGIYLLDEYENSLGVGSISFLPDLLSTENFTNQIIFTSHHPYIISNFPVNYWYVVNRKGSEVNFTYGKELTERYDLSSQEKYIQLLNDPIYNEGVK
jgi:predicted ATPase